MEIQELFLQHLSVERRLSQKTVIAYSDSLRLFARFLSLLPETRTLETADGDNIRDWMESLMEQGRSAAYVNRSLAALRTFYKFCLSEGIVSVDPAHGVVGPKKKKLLPRFVKETEMDRLFDNLDESVCNNEGKDLFESVRDRTIIYVFYLTGLRVSELISLDDTMVDMVSKEMKVTGKRNKQRVVPFGEELLDVLKGYFSVRDENVARQDNALFVSKKGVRMTYDQIRKIVKSILGSVSSQEKLTPHVLRHTFATTMLNHDANLESIKRLLGHQSLETTEVYTHTTFEQLKRIYNDAHPRS